VIGIRYLRKVGEDTHAVELERAEIEAPEKMAEFLNGVRERMFPGVALPPFVPEAEAPKAKEPAEPRRRRLDEQRLVDIVDEDEVAASSAEAQGSLL